jgi:hypothetical protein
MFFPHVGQVLIISSLNDDLSIKDTGFATDLRPREAHHVGGIIGKPHVTFAVTYLDVDKSNRLSAITGRNHDHAAAAIVSVQVNTIDSQHRLPPVLGLYTPHPNRRALLGAPLVKGHVADVTNKKPATPEGHGSRAR